MSEVDDHAIKCIEKIDDAYNYWSGKISELSVVLSLALIAANWAVQGTGGMSTHLLPRLSVLFALLTILFSLVLAERMAVFHDKQHEVYESDKVKWREAAENSLNSNNVNPWPFTRKIELLGFWGIKVKTYLPILSGIFFVITVI